MAARILRCGHKFLRARAVRPPLAGPPPQHRVRKLRHGSSIAANRAWCNWFDIGLVVLARVCFRPRGGWFIARGPFRRLTAAGPPRGAPFLCACRHPESGSHFRATCREARRPLGLAAVSYGRGGLVYRSRAVSPPDGGWPSAGARHSARRPLGLAAVELRPGALSGKLFVRTSLAGWPGGRMCLMNATPAFRIWLLSKNSREAGHGTDASVS